MTAKSGTGTKEEAFFREKKTWSTMKDRILGTYVVPYLNKVSRLRPAIVIVDAFAGPGLFDDGTKGSPLILTNAAEHWVGGRYLAIFGNLRKDHHEALGKHLKSLVDKGRVMTFRGPAHRLLAEVFPQLGDRTLFLYLDPFGLKGCDFASLLPYLQRPKEYSTEILINISPSAIHRLAAARAKVKGKTTPQLQALNIQLTGVLGGDYWEAIIDSSLSPEQKAERVVQGYRNRLAKYLPYCGSCPVREQEHSAIKYYMTFCSRHQDALLLFNDTMCAAYHERIHEARTQGTLFEGTSWKDDRNVSPLEGIIIGRLKTDARVGREELWVEIVKDHFMAYTSSEYRAMVKGLVKTGRLGFEDTKKTGRLNDASRLFLKDKTA